MVIYALTKSYEICVQFLLFFFLDRTFYRPFRICSIKVNFEEHGNRPIPPSTVDQMKLVLITSDVVFSCLLASDVFSVPSIFGHIHLRVFFFSRAFIVSCQHEREFIHPFLFKCFHCGVPHFFLLHTFFSFFFLLQNNYFLCAFLLQDARVGDSSPHGM